MRNEPNFQKPKIFVTAIITTNYNEKLTMDTWSKRTQTNPIYGEQTCLERSRKSRTIYGQVFIESRTIKDSGRKIKTGIQAQSSGIIL
jgi:hypothetical protein